MIYIRSMRLIFLLLLSTYQFRCSTRDLEVKVVSADELLVDIKNNNSSKIVLVNVWSTWCIPCIEEFPYIVDLEKEYENEDLKVVFVSADWDENSQEVYDFLVSEDVKGTHYRKKEGNDENFINEFSSFWSGALPFTGIYNKDMVLKKYWEGKKDEDFFKSSIDSLINVKGEKL
jgi:thiol-disulfide isomerase/thioredoxin